jgi:hypothetical protein
MALTVITATGISNTQSYTFGSANVTGNLTVASATNLGNLSNITITGGSSGNVLTTYGNGVLYWGAGGGGGGGAGTDSYARDTANAAFIQANAAFTRANTGGGGVSNNSTLSGTITPLANTSTQFNIIGVTGDITIAAPAGTPSDGQKLVIRIKDAGTAVNVSWNTIYRVVGTSLPTATVANKTAYIGFIYNTADTDWDAVAVTFEV